MALRLFDVSGRVVHTLFEGHRPAGETAIRWNGRDAAGNALRAGIYLYRLEADGVTASRKLVVSD